MMSDRKSEQSELNNEAKYMNSAMYDFERGAWGWYPFPANARVCVLAEDNCALVQMLRERCASVVVADWCDAIALPSNTHERGQFDYVIWKSLYRDPPGVISIPDAFAAIRALLKPDGKLLLATENRRSARNLCRVNNDGTPGILRNELAQALLSAGFRKYKFFYPMPDVSITQAVYTDAWLPDESTFERVLPYSPTPEGQIEWEGSLLRDAVENHAFPFLCNSYIVEATIDGELCPVDYVALSADRGPERSFATAVTRGGNVRKQPLYTQGILGAQQLCSHIDELERHGVPVLEHRLINGTVEIPFADTVRLAEQLKIAAKTAEDEFFRLWEELYEWILQSSEWEEDEHVGPVLRRGFIEMVPNNCFYWKVDNRFAFYDQEFVREQCPAKYILFRGIAIFYVFYPQAEQYVSKEKIKAHFGLSKLWDEFQNMEDQFILSVQNRERYADFHRMTQPNWRQMKRNRLIAVLGERFLLGRKLILFGTGKYFDAYMDLCGDIMPPVFAVDSNEQRWNTQKSGIPIFPPQRLLEYTDEESILLICCKDNRTICEWLEIHGIDKYDIFSPEI